VRSFGSTDIELAKGEEDGRPNSKLIIINEKKAHK
jgi:hypothetical protein